VSFPKSPPEIFHPFTPRLLLTYAVRNQSSHSPGQLLDPFPPRLFNRSQPPKRFSERPSRNFFPPRGFGSFLTKKIVSIFVFSPCHFFFPDKPLFLTPLLKPEGLQSHPPIPILFFPCCPPNFFLYVFPCTLCSFSPHLFLCFFLIRFPFCFVVDTLIPFFFI